MLVKKFNAICSLMLTAALCLHLATMSYSMITGWYDYNICKNFAHAAAYIAAMHVATCLFILFFMNDGSDCRNYKYLKRKCIVQRASGLVVIALLHLHVKAFEFIVSGEALSSAEKAWILITEIIFFGAIFMHLAVSFKNSLISLGIIRSDASEKDTGKISCIICFILFALAFGALFYFVINWNGFAG